MTVFALSAVPCTWWCCAPQRGCAEVLLFLLCWAHDGVARDCSRQKPSAQRRQSNQRWCI